MGRAQRRPGGVVPGSGRPHTIADPIQMILARPSICLPPFVCHLQADGQNFRLCFHERTMWNLIRKVLPPLLLVALVAGCKTSEGRGAALPKHFVFFGAEHERIKEAAFLDNPHIAGAQLKYTWRELEPERDHYEFRALIRGCGFPAAPWQTALRATPGRFIWRRHPRSELSAGRPGFLGRRSCKYDYEGDDESKAKFDGWVARRWDPAVRARFSKLLDALGKQVDGRIEGLNLAESAVSGESGKRHPPGLTYASYVDGVEEIMTAARKAFPRSCVIEYANFMPGEWLPWSDHGYLRAV